MIVAAHHGLLLGAGGGGGAGASADWIFTDMVPYLGNTDWRISEIQFFNGATQLTPTSVTASYAPATGSTANIIDGSLSSEARWQNIRASALTLRFTFATAVAVDGIKIGQGVGNSSFCSRFLMWRSDDGGSTRIFHNIVLTPASPADNTLTALISTPAAVADTAAHRYWRWVSLDCANNDFENSELSLYAAGVRQGSGINYTTSSTLSFGSINNANDANLGNRFSWTASVMMFGGWHVTLDLGSGNSAVVDTCKIGSFDTSNKYPLSGAVMFSDDNTNFYLKGFFTGLSYPGANTYGSTITLAFPT